MGVIEGLFDAFLKEKPVYDNGFDDLLRNLMEIAGSLLVIAIFI